MAHMDSLFDDNDSHKMAAASHCSLSSQKSLSLLLFLSQKNYDWLARKGTLHSFVLGFHKKIIRLVGKKGHAPFLRTWTDDITKATLLHYHRN